MRHVRTPLFPLAFVAVAAFGAGCISAKAQLYAGPTVTTDGEVDVQAGLALGFGYALPDASAVHIGLGVGGGSRNEVELTDTIEYIAVPEKDWGYRLGVTAQIPLKGDDVGFYAQGGLLFPIRYKSRSGGHEKGFQTRSTSVLAIGVRTLIGIMLKQRDGENSDTDARGAFGSHITLDWMMFSRVR